MELTEFGGEVMRGHGPFGCRCLRTAREPAGKAADKETRPAATRCRRRRLHHKVNEPDPEVSNSLKRWRDEIADEAGVPPYCILSNDTLAELARRRPKTREQLLAVKGIGPAKAERYGQTLLEIVAEAGRERDEENRKRRMNCRPCGNKVSDSPCHPHSSLVSMSPRSRPSHYWTQRLLAAGFTVDECAAIRGLTREVVLEHARLAESSIADPTRINDGRPQPDEHLLRILDAYLAQLQAGGRPDRGALLREHPELASALDCLDALEVLAPPAEQPRRRRRRGRPSASCRGISALTN